MQRFEIAMDRIVSTNPVVQIMVKIEAISQDEAMKLADELYGKDFRHIYVLSGVKY